MRRGLVPVKPAEIEAIAMTNEDQTETIIALEREKVLLYHEIRDALAQIAHELRSINEAMPNEWISTKG